MDKTFDSAEYAAQKRAEIEALTKTVEAGIKACRNSDNFKDYLRMQAKMPKYSVNNCLLLLAQSKGQISQVASYTTWKSLGRQVEKGQKGMQIFCPALYKKQIEVERKDRDGNIIMKDGKPVMETAEVPRMGFKLAYVFDVSQTSGAELPSPVHKLTGNVRGYDDLMAAIRTVSPVPIEIGHIEGSANGYYSPDGRKIVISDALEPMQQIKTTLHELSHAYLDTTGQDQNRSREERETEAEAISFIMTSRLLGDQISPEEVGEYSFGYLASWGDDQLTEFKECLTTIQKSSEKLIDGVEKAWDSLIKERENEVQHDTAIPIINLKADNEQVSHGIHM